MIYSSPAFIAFIIVFVPLFYRADTNNAQTLMIFLGSCFFLAFSGIENLVMAMVVIATSYIAHRVSRTGHINAIPIAIALLLANLTFFKALPLLREQWGLDVSWFKPSGWAVPLGLSFYTFQIVGGLIEMAPASKAMPVTRFVNFIMFFPHLIAGPICKSRVLIPQFDGVKQFGWRNLRIGFHLFLLGYVKKVLIADPIGQAVDGVWAHPGNYASSAAWLACIGFYLQVYADFSGYTDMGRGVARVLGFRLPINFRAPYLAASPLDFWQRWHISLTTWFRHYFYQPIALWLGRHIRDRRWRSISLGLAAFGVLIAIGLWHGIALRFVLFGAFHGALLLAWLFLPFPRDLRGFAWLFSLLLFQIILMLSFIMFRAVDVAAMADFVKVMAGYSNGAQHISAGTLIAVSALALFAIQATDYWITTRRVAVWFVRLRASNLALCLIVIALIALVGYKLTLALAAPALGRASSDGFIYFDF